MNLRIHVAWVIILVVVLSIFGFSFHYWLVEHDARLNAEAQEKTSEEIIKHNSEEKEQLKQQISDIEASRDKKISILRKQQATIKTPVQAVPAIIDITGLPVTSFKPLPSGDFEVTAPVTVTIAQKLVDGQVCTVQLNACNEILSREKQNNQLLLSDNTELTKEKDTWKKASGHRTLLGKVWEGTKNVAAIGGAVAILITVARH